MSTLFRLDTRRRWWISYTLLFVGFAMLFFASSILSGKSPIRVSDGLEQHYASFVYIGKWFRGIARNIIEGNGLVVPLWDTSMGYGADIITSWCLFFCDPLYLLSAGIPTRWAELGYDFVIVLRLYLSGLTFALYSSCRGNSPFSTLLGALGYAFSGWMLLSFSESTIVMPCVYLPLMLLGLDLVLERRSPLLLIASTAGMFVFYFYFGYMMCIFMPAYAIVRLLFPRDGLCVRERSREYYVDALRRFGRAAGCFALGVAASAFIVLPVISVMASEGRLGLERWSPFLYDLSYYPEVLTGLVSFAGVGPDCYIGCGVLFVPCATLLLFRRKKNRALFVCLIGLTIVLLVPFLGRILNGMGYVANRWAFVFALCEAMVVSTMIDECGELNQREARALLSAPVALGLVAIVFPNVRTTHVFASILITMFVCVLLLLRKSDVLVFSKRTVSVLLLVSLAFGCAVPAYFLNRDDLENPDKTGSMTRIKFGTAKKQLIDSPVYLTLRRLDDTSLWRYDCAAIGRVRNSDMVANRNSFDFYMSVYNGNVEVFEHDTRLFTSSSPQVTSGPSGSSHLYSLFGTKYFVTQSAQANSLPFGFSREPIDTAEVAGTKYGVYRNELALPLACTYEKMMSEDAFDSLLPTERRECLLQSIVTNAQSATNGTDGLVFESTTPELRCVDKKGDLDFEDGFVEVRSEGASVTYEFEGNPNSETYVEFSNMRYEDLPPTMPKVGGLPSAIRFAREAYLYTERYGASITVAREDDRKNSFTLSSFKNHMYGGKGSALLCLGYSKDPAHRVTLTFNTPGRYTFDAIRVVQQPMDSLAGLVETRRSDNVTVVEGVNSYDVDATIKTGKYLFLSVPYSTGWKATVDGKEVEVLKADKAFMAVEVPEGQHTVHFQYFTPLLKEGIAISAAAVLASVAVTLRMKKTAKGRKTCETESTDMPKD